MPLVMSVCFSTENISYDKDRRTTDKCIVTSFLEMYFVLDTHIEEGCPLCEIDPLSCCEAVLYHPFSISTFCC